MNWRRNIDSGERYKDSNGDIKRVTNKNKFKLCEIFYYDCFVV